MKNNIIVGLDIGTTKIATVISEIDENDNVNVIGVGNYPPKGFRNGIVVDLDRAAQSIIYSVTKAEQQANVKVDTVYAGIAAEHIEGRKSHGEIIFSHGNKKISDSDVAKVIRDAKSKVKQLKGEVIYVLPHEYTVDEQNGITNPVGMSGGRLQVDLFVVSASAASIQNICESIELAGLRLNDLAFEPLATGYSVLTSNEREVGVALLDIGGEITNLAVFLKGNILHTAVIKAGGTHLTDDIATVCQTSLTHAEELKKRYGCVFPSASEEIEMQSLRIDKHDNKLNDISRYELGTVIGMRLEEIFDIVYEEMEYNNLFSMISAGIVITGGTSLMNGITEIAERVLRVPVKRGILQNVKLEEDIVIDDATYATGIGLTLYGANKNNIPSFSDSTNSLLKSILKKIKRKPF